MSKIGLRPIKLGKAKVEVSESLLKVVGQKGTEQVSVPAGFSVKVDGDSVIVAPSSSLDNTDRKVKTSWGTFRALLANAINGVQTGFESVVIITGLGYKAVLEGKSMVFSLGYSHKLRQEIPSGVSVELDKTGQRITVRSNNALTLGDFCASLKSLRKVEPYKATGIIVDGDKIIRKAGKSTK